MIIQTTKKLKNGKYLIESTLNNRTVGRIKFDTFSKPVLYIELIFVSKDNRRSYIGTSLIKQAIEFAQFYCCSIISLYVKKDNIVALTFYNSLGFFITFDKKNRNGDAYWLMSMKVSPYAKCIG